MSNTPDNRGFDPRLHEFLDGEMTPSESAAFEGELRPGTTLGTQLDLLKHLGTWTRATRSRSPSSLAQRVEEALRAERRPAPSPASALWRRFLQAPRATRVWIPAAAIVALFVALLQITPDRVMNPSGDRPQSPDHASSLDPGPGGAPSPRTGGDPALGGSGRAKPGSVRYVFTLQAGSAREVCLAGDFNQWKVCDTPLAKVAEDTWTISVDLPPGRHEYMFVIDGRWVTDPQAPAHADDGFGNLNAVVVI